MFKYIGRLQWTAAQSLVLRQTQFFATTNNVIVDPAKSKYQES